MNATDLTVFVVSCGNNPNHDDCLRALQSQTAVRDGTRIVEIRNVAPMNRAFQAMIDQCKTRYYIQVDEDMILEADAAEGMLGAIRNAPEKTAFCCFMLHDVHLDMDIQGVKIYDHAVMEKYPYVSADPSVISCEKHQFERIRADGYRIAESRIVMGEHSPKWTPRLIFNRYFRLMEKWKLYGYYWLEDLPRTLAAMYAREPSENNLYAMLGAWASASTADKLVEGEDDFRVPPRQYLWARGWFSQPTQATLYLTNKCNLKCDWCLRQGTMAQVSPAPDFNPFIVEDLLARMPSIRSICLCGFGETLMHPQIGRIIDICRQHKLWIGLITNGTLLEDAWPTLLAHRPSCISISLNAASASEHARECGVPGAWDKIVGGIAAMREHTSALRALASTDEGIPLFLSRVCTAQNLDGVAAFLQLAMDLKIVSGVDLHNILPHDVGTPEKEQEFLDQVLTNQHWEAIQTLKSLPGAELVRSWPVCITPDTSLRNCEYPFYSLAVDGNKDISLCNSVMPPHPDNANLNDVQLWHGAYAMRTRMRFADEELPAWCRWCFRNYC